MTVRNEEKKAFRDLSKEDKLAIIEAKLTDTCEVWHGQWHPALYDDTVCLNTVYRTRPRQLVIPWEVIKPEYKWAAMDESGVVWMHKEEPGICLDGWFSTGNYASAILNIDTTGIGWRESLTQRPE